MEKFAQNGVVAWRIALLSWEASTSNQAICRRLNIMPEKPQFAVKYAD
jgi:hypothetical protein